MKVRLHGNVTIYERRGQVQLKVTIMETQGVGELYKTFEALKKSLEKNQRKPETQKSFRDRYLTFFPNLAHRI